MTSGGAGGSGSTGSGPVSTTPHPVYRPALTSKPTRAHFPHPLLATIVTLPRFTRGVLAHGTEGSQARRDERGDAAGPLPLGYRAMREAEQTGLT